MLQAEILRETGIEEAVMNANMCFLYSLWISYVLDFSTEYGMQPPSCGIQ